MKLRTIEFGTVWGASGVQGFFGEGYWFHKVLEPVGLDFRGSTFVAKTTTLLSRKGNMALTRKYRPKELFPKCIVANFREGAALNSVGLSGPGAAALLETGLWQARRDNFFLSFMSVEENPERRIEELKQFSIILSKHLPSFQGNAGLQINFSCPNVGIGHAQGAEFIREVNESLTIADGFLGIPLVPKFNVLLAPQAAYEISRHPSCDAICVSNTIPWTQIPQAINKKELFGSLESPIAHLGGGGLSGAPLHPLVREWVIRVRHIGLTKPINAGGGILSMYDARDLLRAGANSVFLGSIAFLRPWRVRGIIRTFSRA